MIRGNSMNSINYKLRETSRDYRHPYRPRLLSALNALGRTMGKKADKMICLDPDILIKKAMKATGLTTIGNPEFKDRLRMQIDSIENEARLSFLGRIMAQQNLIRTLANRIRIEAAFEQHPEIHDIEIEDPVFIIGLQRTGTTKTQRLLSYDGDHFRSLASWEAATPAPLHPDSSKDVNKRKRIASMASKAVKYMAPDFFAIHPIDVNSPEEDCMLFDYDFWSTVPEATMRVPSFSAWLESQDHTEAYRYYKEILKFLYWQDPHGRWVLKTPQHMEHFKELFTVFPNARVIHTYRDPAKVVPSFCSMVSHGYGIFSDEVDPVEIAGHWFDKAQLMVKRYLEIREKISPEHFIDISYYDLIKDPIKATSEVYDFLSLSFSDNDRERIIEWEKLNPQYKYGRHVYDAADFALSDELIRSNMADYMKQFNIPEEI